MQSKASLGGHPFHPMLVPIPIGLITWTFIADIVYLLTDKDETWYDIAFWSGLAAWISALVAALPGFVDYFTMAVKSDAKTMARAHLILNVTVVGLFIIASAFMWDDGARTGNELTLVVILHALGAGLLAMAGWLGGEMVYRRHLSMIPDDIDLERAELQRHFEPRGRTGERRV